MELWEWWERVRDGDVDRRNISIRLLDDKREVVARWQVHQAWPIRYTAPDLNAESDDVIRQPSDIYLARSSDTTRDTTYNTTGDTIRGGAHPEGYGCLSRVGFWSVRAHSRRSRAQALPQPVRSTRSAFAEVISSASAWP